MGRLYWFAPAHCQPFRVRYAARSAPDGQPQPADPLKKWSGSFLNLKRGHLSDPKMEYFILYILGRYILMVERGMCQLSWSVSQTMGFLPKIPRVLKNLDRKMLNISKQQALPWLPWRLSKILCASTLIILITLLLWHWLLRQEIRNNHSVLQTQTSSFINSWRGTKSPSGIVCRLFSKFCEI